MASKGLLVFWGLCGEVMRNWFLTGILGAEFLKTSNLLKIEFLRISWELISNFSISDNLLEKIAEWSRNE